MKPEIALGIGLAVGITVGILFEHQRFLAEIQNLRRKHSDAPAPNPATTGGPINPPGQGLDPNDNIGASETQVS